MTHGDTALERQLKSALDAQQRGDLAGAHRTYQEILSQQPQHVGARLHLALLHYQGGRQRVAAERLRELLQDAPTLVDGWINLGAAELALEQLDAAEQALRNALELDASLPEAWTGLGNVLQAAGQPAAAREAFEAALERAPNHAAATFNLARLLAQDGQTRAAMQHCEQLLRQHPGLIQALGLKAECELRLGQHERALATLDQALALGATDARLWILRGTTLREMGQQEAACQAFAEALRLDPDSGGALSSLLFGRRQLCQWDGLERLLERFRQGLTRGQSQLAPFPLLAEDSSRREQSRCAELWSDQWPEQPSPDHHFATAEQRLTLGYLSADFHRHPTAYLSAGLFEAHDRSRFRVLAYANGPDDGSAMRQRLVKAFDEFIDLKGMSPSEAAARMRADGVDLLIDLKGHTLDAAPEILALRPAPIQVHYLGYPGTLGAPWIDYLIGDPWVTPPEHGEDYREALARLPVCYQINDRQRPLPAASGNREDHGLPTDGIVLCCFNNAWKFNQDTLDCWLDILRAAPESVLWLLGREGSHLAAKSLRAHAQQAGIDPKRLIFSKSRPLREYLALYHHADLFLDSWPYNAHTTASDALWMGCPVLSWPGATFASRVGASLLAACEMRALICKDRNHYRERALELIRAPEQLRQLRAQLVRQRQQVPLFDTQATTRALEAAYQEMARQYRAGRCNSFDVPAIGAG